MSTSEEYELLAESMDVVRAQRDAARRLLAQSQTEAAQLRDALRIWEISPFIIRADLQAKIMELEVRQPWGPNGTAMVSRMEVLSLLALAPVMSACVKGTLADGQPWCEVHGSRWADENPGVCDEALEESLR